MILTLYYMYATLLQWWRLGSLKNKLNGTFNAQNAIMVCNDSIICETKKVRSFENLLFRFEDRIGCTVVPRQKVSLCHWISFPRDYRYFPIHFNNNPPKVSSPNIYILVQAILDTYNKHSADSIELENFGELIAWRASDSFEAIIKTDLDKLTKLVHCYSQGDIDINHELQLLKIETVDVEGTPTKIKFDKKYSRDSTLKYSHAPIYWRKFADNLKELYSEIRDSTYPKITIENGKPDDIKKVPISEVKPIKKDSRKHEDKNTLEVGPGDYRRHKSSEHKREKSSDKYRTDHNYSKKEDIKHKTSRTEKESKHKDDKEKAREHKKKEEDTKTTSKKSDREDKDVTKSFKSGTEEVAPEETQTTEIDSAKAPGKESKSKKIDRHSKHKTAQSKTDLEKPGKSTDKSEKPAKSTDKSKSESKTMTRRSSSSEKKLVKSMAVCDDNDADQEAKNPYTNEEMLGRSHNCASSYSGVGNGRITELNNRLKPLNILVFADSQVAKENVKTALSSMVNEDKYTIYDLPTDPIQTAWKKSTVLVVVCGTVPPNLTAHLLQFLLGGGQLLCLCSDLLYSVLHTFATAEVREHELVRFTYGKWEQVKMMHHIFCYQASPAKKQFSKDSDHSNPSSGNGSSPVAPRTPSIVEIQHNGQDYVIQVQVLGTEETWHTPSLLLASVKGGAGRAVFSQVHLEINPNQYEDDESKFAALKESDQARLEIFKDILLNHLDIDCLTPIVCNYTPAYFLGRHESKMKLLTESECIKDNILETERLKLKFCRKDENTDCPSASFLPVLIHSCPTNFSTLDYFENLETEHIGRLVIYSDVIGSTQYVEHKKLEHGLVVIARQQTKGHGRSSNTWLSPLGSAPFSLQVHIPLDSPLGKALPLVQHLGTLAIVSAIRRNKRTKDVDIGLKWPNDIYVNGTVKVGGDCIGSFLIGNLAIVTVGCGVNLNNSNPTLCINDVIRMTNDTKGTNMKTISFELYFTMVFNEFERIFKIVQAGDIDYFYELYYTYWLHNYNNEVSVTDNKGVSEKGKIIGIDDFGFLKVRRENGSVMTVHPDGNRFDMLSGLICPKTF